MSFASSTQLTFSPNHQPKTYQSPQPILSSIRTASTSLFTRPDDLLCFVVGVRGFVALRIHKIRFVLANVFFRWPSRSRDVLRSVEPVDDDRRIPRQVITQILSSMVSERIVKEHPTKRPFNC